MIDFSQLFPGRDLKDEWKTRLDKSIFHLPVMELNHIDVDQEKMLEFYQDHRFREHSVFEDEVIQYAFGQRYCSPDDYWPFIIHHPSDLTVELQKEVDAERGIPWWEHQQGLTTRNRIRSLINLDKNYDPLIDERNYTKLPDRLAGTYIEEVMNQFRSPPIRARFVKLERGQEVGMHIDYSPKYALKAHIPVTTNLWAHMEFAGWDNKWMMLPGSAYIVNTAIEHTAKNPGATERVHLVISLDGQGDI